VSDELIAYLFVLRDGSGVKERLHRRLAEAVDSLMRQDLREYLDTLDATRVIAVRQSLWVPAIITSGR
jgi:hypothetical protein